MKADSALLEAYQSWRHLAETERAAIDARQWQLLLHCQECIRELQDRVTSLFEAAQARWNSPDGDRAGENACRAALAELLEIERQNAARLSVLIPKARSRLVELDQAHFNLQRIQRSYTNRNGAAWTAFS